MGVCSFAIRHSLIFSCFAATPALFRQIAAMQLCGGGGRLAGPPLRTPSLRVTGNVQFVTLPRNAGVCSATKGSAGEIDIDALLNDADTLSRMRSQLSKEMSAARIRPASGDSKAPAANRQAAPNDVQELKATYNATMQPSGQRAQGGAKAAPKKAAAPKDKSSLIALERREMRAEMQVHLVFRPCGGRACCYFGTMHSLCRPLSLS